MVDDGLEMVLNNDSRFIIMKFLDGKILEAKETDSPQTYDTCTTERTSGA